MSAKLFSVCFAAAAFFLMGIIGIFKGQELFFCLKQALIAAGACWVLGGIWGIFFERIIKEELTSDKK